MVKVDDGGDTRNLLSIFRFIFHTLVPPNLPFFHLPFYFPPFKFEFKQVSVWLSSLVGADTLTSPPSFISRYKFVTILPPPLYLSTPQVQVHAGLSVVGTTDLLITIRPSLALDSWSSRVSPSHLAAHYFHYLAARQPHPSPRQ